MNIVVVRKLVAAGMDVRFIAQEVEGGYTLRIETRTEARLLTAQRGHPRVFKKLDAVASTVKDIGGYSFSVVLVRKSVADVE
jgi:hypothetical protein